MKILLADDNEANCLIALTILERAGHSVVTVRTGELALKLTKLATYDLIILDMTLPVIDGPQALHRIRRESSLNQTALIFAFSANCDAEHRDRFRAAGFDSALSKPLRSGDLESALVNLKSHNTPFHRDLVGTFSLGHIPIIDEDIIHLLLKHSTPDSIHQIQSRVWASIHLKCCIIKTVLPDVLRGDDMALSEFRRAVHSVKNTSDSIGLPRVAHITRNLQNTPPPEIRRLMDAFITTLTESRPALERALSRPRKLDAAVQMRGEDQAKTAHHSQDYSAAIGY